MTNVSLTIKCRSLAAATALGAAGLLTVPAFASADPMFPLAPVCDSYEFAGALKFRQSDNWTVQIPAAGKQLQGRVVAIAPAGREIIYGNPSGGINGVDVIDFEVKWDNGHHSRYFGTISSDGSAHGGRDKLVVSYGTDEPVHDSTTWTTTPPTLKCVAPPQ